MKLGKGELGSLSLGRYLRKSGVVALLQSQLDN